MYLEFEQIINGKKEINYKEINDINTLVNILIIDCLNFIFNDDDQEGKLLLSEKKYIKYFQLLRLKYNTSEKEEHKINILQLVFQHIIRITDVSNINIIINEINNTIELFEENYRILFFLDDKSLYEYLKQENEDLAKQFIGMNIENTPPKLPNINIEGVFFPPYYSNSIPSDTLCSFFNENGISEDDSFFDINLLRILVKKDKKKFQVIKDELELRGFNFITKSENNFFPPNIDYLNCEYVIYESISEDDTISVTNLHFFKLDGIFNVLGSYKKSVLNYIPIERMKKYYTFNNITIGYLGILGYIISKKIENTKIIKDDISGLIDNRTCIEYNYIINKKEDKVNIIDNQNKTQIEEELKNNKKYSHIIIDVQQNESINESKKRDITTSIYKNVNKNAPFHNTLNINFMYRHIIKFICQSIKYPNEIKLELENNGFTTSKSLLDINEDSLKELIDKVYIVNEYRYWSSRFEDEIKEVLNVNNHIKHLIGNDKKLYEVSFDEVKLNDKITPLLLFNEQKRKVLPFNNYSLNLNDVKELINISEQDVNMLKDINICCFNDLYSITNDTDYIKKLELKNRDLIHILYDYYAIFDQINCELYEEPVFDNDAIDRNIEILSAKLDYDTYYEEYIHRVKGAFKYDKLIKKREEGLKLEQIGKEYELTRERVRQIEFKVVSKIEGVVNNLLTKAFKFQSMFDKDDFTVYTGSRLLLDKLNKYILLNKNTVIEKHNNIYYNQLIDDLYNNENDIFNKEKLVQKAKHYGLNINNVIYQKEKDEQETNNKFINLTNSYLIKKGEKGYNRITDIKDFIKYIKNQKGEISLNERAVNAYIERCDKILINKSTYMHPTFLKDNQKQITLQILDELSFTPSGITIREIFEKNQDILKKENIDNQYFLYGIIKSLNSVYTTSGKKYKIFKGESVQQDYYTLVEEYLKVNNGIESLDTLKKYFNLSDGTIQNICNNNILKYDSNTLILVNYIKINDIEKNNLMNIIDLYLEKEIVSSSTKLLSRIMSEINYLQLFDINKISNNTRLIKFISALYKERYNYNFTYNSICLSSIYINNFSDILRVKYKNNYFTEVDLIKYCKEYEVRPKKIADLSNLVYRISYSNYTFKENICFDKDLLYRMNQLINNEYEEQIIIPINYIIKLIKDKGIGEIYYNNEELLVTHISCSNCDWCRPFNNINNSNQKIDYILLNKQKIKNSLYISDYIKEYIINKIEANKYYTINEINEILLEDGIISNNISDKEMNKIFGEYIKDELIIKEEKNEY